MQGLHQVPIAERSKEKIHCRGGPDASLGKALVHLQQEGRVVGKNKQVDAECQELEGNCHFAMTD